MLPEHLNVPRSPGPKRERTRRSVRAREFSQFHLPDSRLEREKGRDRRSSVGSRRAARALKQHGFKLERIFLTHTHHDHIAGVPRASGAIQRNSCLRSSDGCAKVEQESRKLRPALFPTGNRSSRIHPVKVMHTPGHSAGECCYFFERGGNYLFTGDTLFIRDCGRTDFEDGSNDQMFASLQRIKALARRNSDSSRPSLCERMRFDSFQRDRGERSTEMPVRR